ncbi:MAG: 2-dehydropantoate 2-reductase N-terminal domain-containing protein [Alcanivoracaceae bacterium]|nr:2-dehydropantoate 2-reductase N-terminal domain-containing protein [Alcanivoracaceae bacterium]
MAGKPQVTRPTPAHILIIGSGAVGAVYARYLVKAGCLVSFLARDNNSANAQMPRTLHHYPLLGKAREKRQNLPVITDAGAGHFDQVWLCLPSTALDNPWLQQQLDRLRGCPALVAWTPDVADMDKLASQYPGSIAQGLIGLISFQTPLPGYETPTPGIGFLAPPRSAVLDNSDAGRLAARLLKQGGLPATTSADLPWLEGRLAAATICAVAGLEAAGWSLKGFSGSAWLPLAADAGIEATRITGQYLGRSVSRPMAGPRKLALKTIMTLGPRVMPFDLETYLHYHFAKVGDQTRQILAAWISRGQTQGLPTSALESLASALTDLSARATEHAA